MPVLNRYTLKRDFATGKSPKNAAFQALIDSSPNLASSTAQSFGGDIVVGQAVATAGVSAGEVNSTGLFAGSAAQFEGIVTHGVSAASATRTIGYPLLTQEATAAASATAQIALLPESANIVGFGLRVLANSSGAAGGTQILVGNQSVIDYFGSITVSAAGSYRISGVSARRLTGTSGAVMIAAPTATAATNFVGRVEYYHRPPASALATESFSLVEVSALGSAIGNTSGGGGLSAAFDGVTDQAFAVAANALTTTRGFVGQAWNAAKRIGQFAVWDPSNEGFTNQGANTVTIRLYGHNDSNIAAAAVLASTRQSYVIPTVVVTVAQSDIDTTNAYLYHWIQVSGGGGGNTNSIAEARFWELI